MHFKNKKLNRKLHFAKTKSGKKKTGDRGFTLLELLTVLAIFAILTVITVSNYNSFTNDTILTNMAYEMALSVREAQTYGIAVSNRTADNFDNPFGINFDLNRLSETQVYHLFEDSADPANPDFVYSNPGSCVTSGPYDYCYKEYVLQRNIVIKSLAVQGSSGCHTDLDTLDITFNRPNPEPFITGDSYEEQSVGQIELQSPEGRSRYVIVRQNGQIYVDSKPICSV